MTSYIYDSYIYGRYCYDLRELYETPYSTPVLCCWALELAAAKLNPEHLSPLGTNPTPVDDNDWY